ncbi:MAG: 6-phosphofructokinase 2 [Thermosipho sp. (in: thermotogales)]|nr:6-phosphofructokinase 2 [Thermosipho sp. (in: thermotogales)]MDN5325188.1 6-phosphofructokinase 2 [Thermosipho sp. (in: thermotogales)]
MIFTLTMNPCLDRYIYINKLTLDDTIRAKKIKDYPAGKGIDVSRVIKELDGISIAIAFLGGETGSKIERMLDKEGVIYSSIRVENETRMNIILESKEGQYRISMPGARISKKKLNVVFEMLDALVRKGDIVVISGSLPLGVKPEIYYEIIKLLKNKKSYVYFDADGEKLKFGIKAGPDVIKPNKYEFSRLIEREINENDFESLVYYGKEIIEKFGIKEILLTLGSKGSLLITKKDSLYSPPLNVPVISAVGAGDSFLAAYVLKRSENKDLLEAFKWANAAGNAAVMTPGTELCRKNDVLSLLEQIEIQHINK